MGLASLREKKQAAEAKAAQYDRPDINWLKVEQGSKVDVVFLEELEDIADTHCVEEWEVNGPAKGQYRTLVDTTEEEGSCYAADLAKVYREKGLEDEGYKSKKKTKVYFNVARVDEPGKAYVFSQGLRSGVVSTLIEHGASEEDEGYGGITGVVYRISKGSTNNSPWTIERRPQGKVPEVTATPFEIDHIVRKVALADQPKYLAGVMPELETAETAAPAAKTQSQDSSEEW